MPRPAAVAVDGMTGAKGEAGPSGKRPDGEGLITEGPIGDGTNGERPDGEEPTGDGPTGEAKEGVVGRTFVAVESMLRGDISKASVPLLACICYNDLNNSQPSAQGVCCASADVLFQPAALVPGLVLRHLRHAAYQHCMVAMHQPVKCPKSKPCTYTASLTLHCARFAMLCHAQWLGAALGSNPNMMRTH